MVSTRFFRSALAVLISSSINIQHAAGQTSTSCQPLNTTNCPPDPAFGMSYNFNFNTTPTSGTWDATAGTVGYSADKGAAFTINKQGDSPTIRSSFYIFFGRVEIWMKASPGKGIVSSVMLLSDDLDEIDWEFLGGDATQVSTNYFGKGVKDYTRSALFPVNGGVQDDYHNYTLKWTNTSMDFYVDSKKVRSVTPKEANNTLQYPQTPMRISLGIWAGGDPRVDKGTREWAGGDTDYSKAPFTMYVKSTQVTDYGTGKEYSYSDHSGTWQSIKSTSGNSTAHDAIFAPPTQSLSDKWNALSPTAHIAIYASAGGVGAAFVAFALYYCIKQRRRGAREAKLAEQRQIREREELEEFKRAGIDPDSFVVENSEYDAKEMRKEGMVGVNAYSVPSTPDGGPHEKDWEAAAIGGAAGGAAAAGMRSPVPLLRDGAQSPRVGGNPSQAPYHDAPYGSGNNLNPQDRMRSPAPLVSPIRTPSPGMPPSFPPPASPANRSFSSPHAQMRGGSPGPQMGGYSGIPRTQSPAAMGGQQRSFTGPSYGGNGGGYRGTGGGYGGAPPRGYGGSGGNGGYYR